MSANQKVLEILTRQKRLLAQEMSPSVPPLLEKQNACCFPAMDNGLFPWIKIILEKTVLRNSIKLTLLQIGVQTELRLFGISS